MRLATAFAVILAVAYPCAAAAVEVKLGGETEAVYDSNVFRLSDDKKDDASFRFSPTIDISEQTDKLGASLYYKPTYEVFTQYTDANALSHYLFNNLTYRFTPKTNVELGNLFRVMSLLNYDQQNSIDDTVETVPDNDIERDEVLLYDSDLRLTHALTSRWQARSDVSFNLFDPQQRDDSVGSKTVSAFQNFTYAHDRANLFGIGGGAVIQMFDEIRTLPASNTYIFRLFGTYERHFGESTTLTVQVGPAFILTRQDDASSSQSATYPFYRVSSNTTVGALRQQGIAIESAGGQNLTNSTPVAAGSVVVPDPGRCIGSETTVLFETGRCNVVALARSDVPGEQEQAALIRDENSTVEIQGSNAGSDDSTFSIFGDITLEHYWTPNLISTVNYNRNESTASGQGTSTIADTVSFITVWRPTPLWDLSMRGSYVKRNSPTDLSRSLIQVTRESDPMSLVFGFVRSNGLSTVIEDSDAVDTERWEVAARVARRVTRHITVSAWAAYSDQSSTNTTRNPNDFGDFTAILGFKYDFDPFRF